MKFRTGFVSNSSSSAFILQVKNEYLDFFKELMNIHDYSSGDPSEYTLDIQNPSYKYLIKGLDLSKKEGHTIVLARIAYGHDDPREFVRDKSMCEIIEVF